MRRVRRSGGWLFSLTFSFVFSLAFPEPTLLASHPRKPAIAMHITAAAIVKNLMFSSFCALF
jgi:hypothetical protein